MMKNKFPFIFALLISTAFLTGCATNNSSTNSSSSSSASSQTTSVTSQQRVFTLTELATYNGDNGKDAYIAVSGVVYDVTNADGWDNGWHKDMHQAGTDATAAFAGSPHSQSILNSFPIVGILEV